MAVQVFTTEYSLDAVTWTLLTNVQSISGDIGRKSTQDTFEPSSFRFEVRYPTGFSSPNTALVVDTWIRVKRTGSAYEMWRGKIRNVFASWDKPYAGGVGVNDRLTIEAEGAFAQWGRADGNGQYIAAANAYFALAEVSFEAGLPIGTTYLFDNSPNISASVVDNSYAQWILRFAETLGATVKDGGGQLGVYTKDFVGSLAVNFSDAANNRYNQQYDSIQFNSRAADFYTQVNAQTYVAGDVVTSTGSAPYRTLRVDTWNESVAQATDLGNYLLGVYAARDVVISEISCTSEGQSYWNLDLEYAWYDILGYRTNVTFRGTTYYMTILGSSFTATPSGSRFTYYLAPIERTPYLFLDSTVFGILDTNRLSW